MSKDNRKPRRTREQFDLNSVVLTGQIMKLWGRSGDVYARLRISTRDRLVEPDDEFVRFANVRFPQGGARGHELPLQGDEIVRLTAFIVHTGFQESIRRFLDLAGASDFLDKVPKEDLSLWRGITFRRTNAMLNVRRAALLSPSGQMLETTADNRAEEAENELDPDNIDVGQVQPINRVVVEGVVAKLWSVQTRSADLPDQMVRLAVYDRTTPIERGDPGDGGSYGRPRRKPHYVNVLLPGGMTTTGRPVSVRLKDRVRVTGQIGSRFWAITLREALVHTGVSEIIEAMQRVGNQTDRLDMITINQEATHVEAQAIIKYS